MYLAKWTNSDGEISSQHQTDNVAELSVWLANLSPTVSNAVDLNDLSEGDIVGTFPPYTLTIEDQNRQIPPESPPEMPPKLPPEVFTEILEKTPDKTPPKATK